MYCWLTLSQHYCNIWSISRVCWDRLWLFFLYDSSVYMVYITFKWTATQILHSITNAPKMRLPPSVGVILGQRRRWWPTLTQHLQINSSVYEFTLHNKKQVQLSMLFSAEMLLILINQPAFSTLSLRYKNVRLW